MVLKSEEQGDDIYLRRYEHFPEYYRAANIEQGLWTAPYFDCDGLVTLLYNIFQIIAVLGKCKLEYLPLASLFSLA
jgi:hypothetical protein